MATYNRAHLVEESLNSIQNQRIRDWECLIIDDGSNDNTEEIIGDKIATDHRFKFLKRPDNYRKGLPGCRNYGLDRAKGEYIIFFDDDDIVHPENLRFCFDILNSSNYNFIRYNKQPFTGSFRSLALRSIKDSRLTSFSNRDIEKMITGEIPFASCCVLWDKKCFEGERFNESLMYAEEWECYSRILIAGYEGVSTDAVLYFNRKHPISNTGEFRKKIPVRVASQLKAAELVIKNLYRNNLYNEQLKNFFLRMGFNLKSYSLINMSLKAANAGFLEKLKYKLGYKFYPLLKPVFYLKGQIIKH